MSAGARDWHDWHASYEFEERGFERTWLSDPGYIQCAGAHRRIAPPEPLDADAVMFTFTSHRTRTGPVRK